MNRTFLKLGSLVEFDLREHCILAELNRKQSCYSFELCAREVRGLVELGALKFCLLPELSISEFGYIIEFGPLKIGDIFEDYAIEVDIV